MNTTEIDRALRALRLSGMAETLSTRVMQGAGCPAAVPGNPGCDVAR
jgi:hypothetical protein